MDKTYKVIFDVKKLGLYGSIPGLQEAMQSELIRVYNIYADKTNGGITDKLNEEFKQRYGNGCWNSEEYNQFMADGYNRMVVNEFNETGISPILDFYVQPEEVNFTGYLKVDPNVTIEFYLKEV